MVVFMLFSGKTSSSDGSINFRKPVLLDALKNKCPLENIHSNKGNKWEKKPVRQFETIKTIFKLRSTFVATYNFPGLNQEIIFKVLKKWRIFFRKLSLDHRNVSSQFWLNYNKSFATIILILVLRNHKIRKKTKAKSVVCLV